MRTFLNRVANPVVRAHLRSPLHGLAGVGKVLRGAAADGARATLEGKSLAKAAKRFPDWVIVRLRLEPADRL